jgi:DNA polymerase alpha-associated DNA helicase A
MAPSTPTPISIPLFAETQQALLLKEHEAEVSSSKLASTASASPSTRRTLQATGYALTGIILSQCRTGLGGRLVGEFAADAAVLSSSGKKNSNEDARVLASGKVRLGAHGIRVGDIVRVNEVGGSGTKKVGKEKGKGGEESKGPEGVVTKVGESSVWIAFGQRGGGGGRPKEDDEVVEELWGKKLWLYVAPNSVVSARGVPMLRLIYVMIGY